MGEAWRPQALLREDVEGHVGGGRASRIADTVGIGPRRLQEWRAQGSGNCRIGGRTALEIAGWTDIQS